VCLDKKIKIVRMKENECKERKDMIDVLSKRRILMRHEE